MRRLSSAISLTILIALAFTSCRRPTVRGNNELKTEERQLTGSFAKIEISGPVDANIQTSTTSVNTLQFTGSSNLLPYIKTKIENNILKIYIDKDVRLFSDKNVLANIALPYLSALSLAGSNTVHIGGNVTGDKLSLDIAGSGDIEVAALNTKDLEVTIAGEGELKVLSGTVTNAKYNIAGAGELNNYELHTLNTTIEIAGSAEAEISATEKLDISVGGAGTVSYKGNPVVTKEIAGSGTITKVQ